MPRAFRICGQSLWEIKFHKIRVQGTVPYYSLWLKNNNFNFRKEESEKKGKNLKHAEDGGDEFLTVNLDKMLLMLNNVFTLPRSYRSMEGLRTAASDYISQKLGNLGLIVGIQYFFPSRFYHQVI